MLELLSNSSLKNKTFSEFADNNESNYIYSYKVDSFGRGNMKYLYVSFCLPGIGFFDDFDLEKSLKVVKNDLFKSILLVCVLFCIVLRSAILLSFILAVIVTFPVFKALTKPVSDTVAILGSEDDHVMLLSEANIK